MELDYNTNNTSLDTITPSYLIPEPQSIPPPPETTIILMMTMLTKLTKKQKEDEVEVVGAFLASSVSALPEVTTRLEELLDFYTILQNATQFTQFTQFYKRLQHSTQ